MQKNDARVRSACYTANVSMSVVATLSPLLFLTFRNLYGFSFSRLGALVLLNFSTQLAVDLLLSFYSHRFHLARLVRVTPALTALGLFVYAIFPFVFPDKVYTGLVIGTVLFSASGGLAEVLISPVIAALPSEHPERDMSRLHAVYAFGVVGVVTVSTLLLGALGKENWPWMALFWMSVPLLSCGLFARAQIPPLKTPEKVSHVFSLVRQKDFILCFLCIFLGGASECTMSQWSSGYLEQALHIPKVWGDIFGVAMFAVMLGLGRTLYAKYGKNIDRVLLVGAAGAAVCYLAAAVSSLPLIGLFACALTGLCTAMLWPGSLIVASDRFPAAGIAVFALMAAGGDLGGALGPQLVGTVTDLALASGRVGAAALAMGFTTEQLAMKLGLLSGAVFPLLAAGLYFYNYRQRKRLSGRPAPGSTAKL